MRRAIATLVTTLLILTGLLATTGTAANAAPCSDSACVGIPPTREAVAQLLVSYINNPGSGSPAVPKVTVAAGEDGIIPNEILPIANGDMPLDSYCDVDVRTLQIIAVVARHYGSIQINDLNRGCADPSDGKTCAVTVSQAHCWDYNGNVAASGIDIGSIATLGGPSYDSADALFTFLTSVVPETPDGTYVEALCGDSEKQYMHKFFIQGAGCDHHHLDFRGTDEPLNLSTSAPPQGLGSPVLAVQSNTGNAYVTPLAGGGINTSQGMAAGTNPSTARLVGSSASITAYQTNTGILGYYNSTSGASTKAYGFASGTSPSVVSLSDGSYVIAFQSNTGRLFVYSSSTGTASDTAQGMKAATSPSVTRVGGSYAVAFQSNVGDLTIFQNGVGTSTGLGMKAGSSPAISTTSSGNIIAALQANTGNLYTYVNGVGFNTGIGMYGTTSPSITGLTDGTLVAAAEANTGQLWIYKNLTGSQNLGQGMKAGTSPSITQDGSSYAIAFQSNVGNLSRYTPAGGGQNLGIGMAGTTSPSAG